MSNNEKTFTVSESKINDIISRLSDGSITKDQAVKLIKTQEPCGSELVGCLCYVSDRDDYDWSRNTNIRYITAFTKEGYYKCASSTWVYARPVSKEFAESIIYENKGMSLENKQNDSDIGLYSILKMDSNSVYGTILKDKWTENESLHSAVTRFNLKKDENSSNNFMLVKILDTSWNQ